MTKSRRPPPYAVPALEKGLDILEQLASASGPQSQVDLAKTLRRSSSEIFRMLACLQRRGYIIKDDPLGAYSLSLKLYQLAHTHSPVDQLLQHAAGPMRALALEVRESCHLSVLMNDDLVPLAQVESPERLRFSVEVGGRWPAVHTVSGRLLLSYLPEVELSNRLDRDRAYTRLTPVRRQWVRSKILETQQNGYSFAENETVMGIRDLAVLVGDPRANLAAALAIASLVKSSQTDNTAQLLTALRRCAKTINKSLGLTA